MKKTKNIIVNLFFSIKQVFNSSPYLFIVCLFISLINQVSVYAIMYISRLIINQLQQISIGQASVESIFVFILLSVGVSIILLLMNWINSVLGNKQKYNFSKYIDKIFIEKNSTLDIAVFDNPNYYNILEEAERSKQSLNFIVYRVIHFISYIISLIISLVIAFSYQDKYLVLIIFVFVIPSLFNKGKYYTELYKYDVNNRATIRKTSYMANILLGKNTSKEIRFYNTKDYLLNKYKDNVNLYMKGKKRIIRTLGLRDSIFNIMPMLGVMIAMFIVTKNILLYSGAIGDFVFFMGIFITLKDNFLGLIEDVSKLQESENAIKKYKEYMEMESIIYNDGQFLIDKIDTIEFVNVTFAYPNTEKKVLNKINFSIELPQKTAIVGLNGAGKTTIVKLLLRFYDVDTGEILINGINIKKIDLNHLRKLITPAFQDSVIYSMSLRENVSLSDLTNKNNDKKIIDRLKMFGLDNLANSELLEKDVSRDFSEDGIMLSGGQNQKLALSRCAFPDADLYIMDEPTAALDPISEHEILLEFQKLYSDKGLIMVSHRLSNVVLMDNILVLNNGEIIEQGNHKTLYDKKGLYYEMFYRQSSNFISSDEGMAL